MQRNPRYSHRISNVPTDAVIIPRNTWKFVKKEAVHRTAAEEVELQQTLDLEKKTQMEAFQTKRERLLDAEVTRQSMMKQNATQSSLKRREEALRVAQAKANEELDEVKLMNADVMAARVRTIRDAELMAKKQRLQREAEIERKENEEMEENRKRAVEIYRQRETMLLEQRRAGMHVLEEQIQDRKRRDLEERKRREQEKIEMERAAKAIQEEDIRLEKERRARQQEFLAECVEANKQSLIRKQMDKVREAEEVQAIVEYNKRQAAAAEEYERKIAEAKAAKELEIAELRKKQQRTIDTQAERDELLARRVQEEQDRRERERELAEQRRQAQIRADLEADRQQAMQLKQRRVVELARLEKADFERSMAIAKAQREADAAAQRKKQQEMEQYRDQLKKDLDDRALSRRLAPLRNLDEQRHLEEERQDYLDRLEEIRQQKLEMLRAEGVPEKYLADLMNRRFTVK